MNRRSFLRALAIGAVSAATVDVDKLLWQPGEKTYFLPPPARPRPPEGISIRFVRQFEKRNGLFVSRFDILYGWGAIAPNAMMCRVEAA